MKYFYSENTIKVFEKGFRSLSQFHSIMKNKKAVIAYSGGIDSTFLLNFFAYLHSLGKVPEPVIFHLNHGIRDNENQEIEMENFIQSNFSPFLFSKKKTFRYYPSV